MNVTNSEAYGAGEEDNVVKDLFGARDKAIAPTYKGGYTKFADWDAMNTQILIRNDWEPAAQSEGEGEEGEEEDEMIPLQPMIDRMMAELEMGGLELKGEGATGAEGGGGDSDVKMKDKADGGGGDDDDDDDDDSSGSSVGGFARHEWVQSMNREWDVKVDEVRAKAGEMVMSFSHKNSEH